MATREITAATFGSILGSATRPLLVDFWATWCGPCRALAPTVDQIGAEMAGRLDVYKCNVDDEGVLATKFRIVSIPTLILFKNGQPVTTMVGNMPKEELEREIEEAL